MIQFTTDWTDANITALLGMAQRLKTRAAYLGGCWMSESGLHTTAHNPHGN